MYVSVSIRILKSITDTQCQTYSILFCFLRNPRNEIVNAEHKWDKKLFKILLVYIIHIYVVINKCYNTLKSTGRSARSKKFFLLCLTCWRMHRNKPFYYCFHRMYIWCRHISWICKNKRIIPFLQVNNIYIYACASVRAHTHTDNRSTYN